MSVKMKESYLFESAIDLKCSDLFSFFPNAAK